MVFENLDVDIDSLPKIDSEFFNHLNKKYYSVLIIKSFLFSMFLFIAYGVFYTFIIEQDLPYSFHIAIIVLLLIIFIVNMFTAHFGFMKKQFKLRKHDLIYRSGLWWKSETTVPFVRVQHSEVIQGPIERMFNLAKLKLYTAGGHSSDLSVPGLNPQKAEELKDFITKRIQEEEE